VTHLGNFGVKIFNFIFFYPLPPPSHPMTLLRQLESPDLYGFKKSVEFHTTRLPSRTWLSIVISIELNVVAWPRVLTYELRLYCCKWTNLVLVVSHFGDYNSWQGFMSFDRRGLLDSGSICRITPSTWMCPCTTSSDYLGRNF